MALDDVAQRILDDTKLKVAHFFPLFGLEDYGGVIDTVLFDANQTTRKY